MKTFSRWCNYSRGLGRRGSGIRSSIRASKLPRSAKPAKPQSRTLVKNQIMQSRIWRVMGMERRARMKSTTRSFRKSKIRRLKRGNGD